MREKNRRENFGMKKILITGLCAVLLSALLPVTAFAREVLVGGQAVGIQLHTQGVMVVGLAEIETAEGPRSPAADAGFRPGDRIVRIGEREVVTAADFLAAVATLEGEAAPVTAERGGKSVCMMIRPALSREGQWMLGMWLRDGLSGVGTLTFYDPASGVYGALGHAVNDEETGARLTLGSGSITEMQIVGVVPGLPGTPGELSGCADVGAVLGSVEKNTDKGIFGHASAALEGRTMETGEIRPGPATILATVQGREVREYGVQIDRVYSEGGGHRVLLTVTDPALKELTGGIVQGMSGSPILQDGKLVGAVTHVFVNSPERGYGLGIDEMLAEAGLAQERAA